MSTDWIEDESLSREEKLARFDALASTGESTDLNVRLQRGLDQVARDEVVHRDDPLEDE